MNLNDAILYINNILWGWPMVGCALGAALIMTCALYFVQFRYFILSCKLVLFPQKQVASKGADMTPFQSFINALSASVGNGSIAGIATAVYAGGPGVAFWIFIFGLLSMSLRFAEVYLSSYYITSASGSSLGGPMIYLRNVPGKSFLPYLYAFFCLMLAFTSGNAMQANSIRLGVARILPLSTLVIACILLAFITYVMLGGARRIVKVSDAIVPVKVGVFFLSSIIVLVYHAAAIPAAIKTICIAAFTPQAVGGALVGLTVQYVMRYGIARSVNASEAGLGTAAILYGGSGSKDAVRNGIMSMLGCFISANLVCFMVALMLVASGVWNNGLNSLELTISAYETVFGSIGGWIVTFLSVSFGMGVLVAYAYIARACWTFLTGGILMPLFTVLFCAATFFGALSKVDIVWNATDLVNAGLLLINVYGMLWLLPVIRTGLGDFIARDSK